MSLKKFIEIFAIVLFLAVTMATTITLSAERNRTVIEFYRKDGMPRKNYDDCMDRLVASPERYSLSLVTDIPHQSFRYDLQKLLGMGTTNLVFLATESNVSFSHQRTTEFPVALRLPVSPNPLATGNNLRTLPLYKWASTVNQTALRVTRDPNDESSYSFVPDDLGDISSVDCRLLGFVRHDCRTPRVARFLHRWSLSKDGLVRFFVQDYVPTAIPFLDMFLKSPLGVPIHSDAEFDYAIQDLRRWLLGSFAFGKIEDFNITSFAWVPGPGVQLPGETRPASGIVLLDLGPWNEVSLNPANWNPEDVRETSENRTTLALELTHSLGDGYRYQILGTALKLRGGPEMLPKDRLAFLRRFLNITANEHDAHLAEIRAVYDQNIIPRRIDAVLSMLEVAHREIQSERLALLQGDFSW